MNCLNLLPWRFRRRLLLRVRAAQWAVAAALVCGIVLAGAGVQFARIARREQTLVRLEARSASLAEMRAEAARIEGRVAESQRLQSLLSRVENQELPLRAMGLVSRVVASSKGRIEMQSMTFARSQTAVPVLNKPGVVEKEERVTLSLGGKAADNLAVADMVLRLRETNVFDHVDLMPAGPPADANDQVRFQVECAHQSK